jgi:Tfp pilus assembly protein PilF
MAVTTKRLCIVSGLVLFAGGIGFWRHHVVTKRAAMAQTAIEHGLATADFIAARSALTGIADPQRRTAMEHEIRLAELKNALTYRDTGLMRRAIGTDGQTWIPPQLLETAELELAREAVQSHDFDTYQKTAGKWHTKTAMPGQWKLLEADQLLARKLPGEAEQLLKSAQLSGTEDALRHARLSLLEAKEPWKAITRIDEGLKTEPRNADLLSFRAQIEEAAGREEDARLDYVAAVLAERNNPLYRDILANFYLRHGDLPNAAQTWRDAAQDTGLGVYALKCWFWSRMAGAPLTQPLPPCRQPGWTELVTALTATPDGVFWNDSLDAAFTRIHGGNPRPEIIWLRLLESIRIHDLKTARRQLDIGFPREADRLWPDLALRLRVHLAARNGENPRLPLAAMEPPSVADNAHPFLIGFSQWAKRTAPAGSNEKFESWLAKPDALTGILLASGWGGAALTMGKAGQLVPDPGAPEWFDYGYAKSLLMRDGKQPARQWLESLPARSNASDLLLGELRLSTGAVDQGLALLQQIANSPSPIASRAAWTLALAELDRGKPAQARQITMAAPGLAASVPGREILARIALAESARAETLRIYQELGEQSADAMIFLSKEAFAAGDFEQARKWTSKLAQQFPEQPAFRKNLLEINAAAKRTKP